MTPEMVASSIGLTAAFLMFLFACIYMYRQTQLDVFRSDLFAIRDEMFNYMCRNDASFDTPEYRRMRDTINGLIRFAHQFHLASIFLAVIISREAGAPQGRLLDQLNAMPEGPLRDHLLSVYRRVNDRVFEYLIWGGTQAFLVIPAVILYRVLSESQKWLREMPPAFADHLMTLGDQQSDESRRLREALAV